MAPPKAHCDYYAILEVSKSAKSATITASYRRLARAKHPDRNKDVTATADFQQLLEAYEILSDPEKRRGYDNVRFSPQFLAEVERERKEALVKAEWKRKESLAKAERDRKLEGLNRKHLEFQSQHNEQEEALREAKKDLNRLFAEKDSLKGEKERILKEKATAETWWRYACSFVPGKGAEYSRERKRREDRLVEIVGRKRFKEVNLDLKLAEAQSCKDRIQDLADKQAGIARGIANVEEEWREVKDLLECEKQMMEIRKWKVFGVSTESNRRTGDMGDYIYSWR